MQKNYALEVAERIRQEIENYDSKYEDKTIKATISLGVTSITRKTICTANEVIQMADTALYKSKTDGRNRSTLYGCSC